MVLAEESYEGSTGPIVSGSGLTPLAPPTQTKWLLGDHLGSVRDVVVFDGNSKYRDHRVYDSFGNEIRDTKYWQVGSGFAQQDNNVDSVFGYTGREWDEHTKLQYNRARWYDPATGRWLSQDPIGFAAGDANLYRYVGNDATNATDPSGLEIVLPFERIRELIRIHDRQGTLTSETRLAVRSGISAYSFPITLSDGRNLHVVVQLTLGGWFTRSKYTLVGFAPENYGPRQAINTLFYEKESANGALRIADGADVIMAFTTLISDAMDIRELFTGRDATTGRMLTSEEYEAAVKAASFPVVNRKGSGTVNDAVKFVRDARGKGNNITVRSQQEAEEVLASARPDIPWVELTLIRSQG